MKELAVRFLRLGAVRVPLPLWWQLVIQRDPKPLLGLPQLQVSGDGKVAVTVAFWYLYCLFFFVVFVLGITLSHTRGGRILCNFGLLTTEMTIKATTLFFLDDISVSERG